MAFSIAGRRILVVAVIMIAAGMLSSCYTGNCCATFGDGQPSGKRSIRKQGHHSMQLIQIPVARADYEKATTPDDSSGKVMWKPRFSESTDVEKAEKTDDKP
ncbi:MAG: hypothetical protein KKA07_18375, partial [Bacteroidetes bacterium]|nr:hypothetical protein [Bacteroidota bacterium]